MIADRKSSGPSLRRSPPGQIQRNVGFEFEARNQVEEMNNNMSGPQIAGTTLIQPNEVANGTLAKGNVIANGANFELQVDEGADFHLEFVTTGVGFPETSTGRDNLEATITAMETLGNEIIAKGKTPGTRLNWGGNTPKRVLRTNELTGGAATLPERIIHPSATISAEPQTTAGIRLDQLPALMDNMASPTGESQKVRQKRGPARSTLAAKSNVQDTSALREGPPAARQAIDNYKTQLKATGTAVPPKFGSESLVGLMALIYTYLKKAIAPVTTYPKSLFPLLGITDFGTMFGMLPADDRILFTTTPQHFVNINLNAAGMGGSGGTAFFAGGLAAQFTGMTVLQTQNAVAILGLITRQSWLSGIPTNSDQLSNAVSGGGAGLESMGKYNHGEQVGDTHLLRKDTVTDAPILELRRMAGGVGLHNWTDFALDVFDFIVKLNDQKTKKFELDDYDPQNPKP